MKLTEPKRVIDIIQPVAEGSSLHPSVGLFDAVSRVVVIMLQHDLKRIAVMQHGRVVGWVYLSEALNELGVGTGNGTAASCRRLDGG